MDYDVLRRDYQTYLDQYADYGRKSDDFNALVAEYNKEVARWTTEKSAPFSWNYTGPQPTNMVVPQKMYEHLKQKSNRENDNYRNWLITQMNNLVKNYAPTPNAELWSQKSVPFTWRSGTTSMGKPGAIYEKLRAAADKGTTDPAYANWLQSNMEKLQEQYYAKPELMGVIAPAAPNYSVAQQAALNGTAIPSAAAAARNNTDQGLIAQMRNKAMPQQATSISGLLAGLRRST